ncbi:hypothetical protein [Thermococcus sp. LS2]|uniref:hypothetical protein n=1 Tax=Thermococcus sp. LS2 TaxID=1638260 RepID=UPI00143BF162|nr:hypothetical protein [Thermococcus sp. LS2]NJE12259.1 hypothetical protein [Thermococcus sp. LS2]
MPILDKLTGAEKKEKVEFVLRLVDRILTNDDIFNDKILLTDTVEEMYLMLRQLALGSKDDNLLNAFEKIAILRYCLQNRSSLDKNILKDVKNSLIHVVSR